MPQLVATGERSAARARAPVVSFHDGALLTNCNGDVAPTLTKINGGHSFAPSPSTVLSAKSTPIDRRALSVAPSATNRDPRAAAKLRLVVIGSGGVRKKSHGSKICQVIDRQKCFVSAVCGEWRVTMQRKASGFN